MIMMIIFLNGFLTHYVFANLHTASSNNFTVTWEDLLYKCY